MRPETKALYPDNWDEISRACIVAANYTCQECGYHSLTGNKVLTTHHKDYDPSNNAKSNLVCLCQGCHLRRQARELSEAVKYRDLRHQLAMGQLAFADLAPTPPKIVPPYMKDKAKATSAQTADRAQLDTGL